MIACVRMHRDDSYSLNPNIMYPTGTNSAKENGKDEK